MSEIKPAYLIAGSDDAKVDATLARLRERAMRESGEGALETFTAPEGQGAPDADALIAAIPALSLIAERRYLLADRVERWNPKQAGAVAAALAELPPDTTVVLAAREEPPKVKAPKKLAEAVEKAGGDVLSFDAPAARALPRWLGEEARRRGFELEPDAARLLIERMGNGTVRLANELDRLALWAGEGGSVGVEDLDEMVADTSEAMVWSLSDAIVEGRAGAAVRYADRLTAQSEALPKIVYGVAGRLRKAHQAATELEAGRSPREVASGLRMSPYAAKMIVKSVSGTSPAELRAASCALADLEWWSRGGAEYTETAALTLAVRRAAGSGGRR
ncbi:MAG TPA: DNA polymerase III subunit delta [Solirubrobacterales bacterium]